LQWWLNYFHINLWKSSTNFGIVETYWVAFDMTCPKHDPTRNHTNEYKNQNPFKLNLSSFTYYFVKQIKGIQQSFYLVCHGCTYYILHFKNPKNHVPNGLWWIVDEVNNNGKDIITNLRNPKIKWKNINNTLIKVKNGIFPWFFPPYLGAFWSTIYGIKMEIVCTPTLLQI